MAAHKAVAALATDIMQTSVSPAQGRVRALSAKPPQRSMTGSPFRVTATAAPTSPRARKFSANASATAAKRRSQWPSDRHAVR